MSFVLLVSNVRPFTPVSSRNCPHSSRSICPSHFESEADKVQRPRQILLKVSTWSLGLATEKYIQIAVVLVSLKCSPDHRECAKICFPSTRSHKNVQIFLAAILFSVKCCEISTEAIENAEANTFSAGGAPKISQFWAVICILQFGLILGYFSTFS